MPKKRKTTHARKPAPRKPTPRKRTKASPRRKQSTPRKTTRRKTASKPRKLPVSGTKLQKRVRSAAKYNAKKYRVKVSRDSIRLKKGTQFVTETTKFTATRGKKRKLSKNTVNFLKKKLKSVTGKKFHMVSISVKVRYRDTSGRLRNRWDNQTVATLDEAQKFLDQFNKVQYTAEDGENYTLNRGTLQHVVFDTTKEIKVRSKA